MSVFLHTLCPESEGYRSFLKDSLCAACQGEPSRDCADYNSSELRVEQETKKAHNMQPLSQQDRHNTRRGWEPYHGLPAAGNDPFIDQKRRKNRRKNKITTTKPNYQQTNTHPHVPSPKLSQRSCSQQDPFLREPPEKRTGSGQSSVLSPLPSLPRPENTLRAETRHPVWGRLWF